MKKNDLFFIILIIVFLSGSVFAQFQPDNSGLVTGIVLCPSGSKTANLTPLGGARVAIENTNFSMLSEETGKFQFMQVPAGTYKIVVTKDGYFSEEKQITVGAGTPVKISLTLVPDKNQPVVSEPGKTRQVTGKNIVYVAFSEKADLGKNKNYIGLNPIPYIAAGGNLEDLGGYQQPKMPGPYDPVSTVNVDPNTLMMFDPQDPGATSYIRLTSKPFWVAYNSSNGILYVSNDRNQIMLLDTTKNNKWLGVMQFMGMINDIKLSLSGNNLLASVTSGMNNSIAVVDCNLNKFMKTIVTRMPINAVGFSNDGRTYYGASGDAMNGIISAYDTSGSLKAEIQVGKNPICIETSPTKNEIYVANKNSGSISVIDTTTNQVTKTIQVGIEPYGMVFSPDGARLYVTLSGSNQVCAIDTSTKNIVAQIPVEKKPTGIAISSDGKYIFVANNNSSTLSQIDTRGDMVVFSTSSLPQSRPFGVASK